MTIFPRVIPIIALAGALFLTVPAASHSPSEHKEGTHKEGSPMEGAQMQGEEAMKVQHERMANFKEAAEMLSNAIIHGAMKLAQDGAEKLGQSLEGHERDVPHKNRSHEKEFQRLYVELGKRTEKLKAAVKVSDLPRSAVEYGRILEVCAACHRKFRD